MQNHSDGPTAVWGLKNGKQQKKIVGDLVEANLVEPTHSLWAAPSILVKKKDETFRLLVDYRGLNK